MIINFLLFLLTIILTSILNDIFIFKIVLIPIYILYYTLNNNIFKKNDYIYLFSIGIFFDICFTHILFLNSIIFILLYEFVKEYMDKVNIFILNVYSLILYLVINSLILYIFDFNLFNLNLINTLAAALFINSIIIGLIQIFVKIREHRIK